MSDNDRKRYVLANKNKRAGDRGYSKSSTSRESNKQSSETSSAVKLKQPTILLKAREATNDDAGNPQKQSPQVVHKESKENTSLTSQMPQKDPETNTPILLKSMSKSMKLIEDGCVNNAEVLQEYLQENEDFLVIGVIGAHGVGKSTLLNLLAHNSVTEDIMGALFRPTNEHEKSGKITILTEHLEKMELSKTDEKLTEIFKVQNENDVVSNMNATHGIDMFVTENRVIFLDCQPIFSVAILDELIECENKRTNLVSEFIPLENSSEIQALQLATFLMSVCHVMLVVQDWFFDSNVVRFLQTAEMLKPTIPNPEDEFLDHFPHIVLVHNKALLEDFTPTQFRNMQHTYKVLFKQTKLQIQSNIGMGSGRIISSLNVENCGSPINLFLIQEISFDNSIYSGHPPLEDLIKRLRANLLGATKNPLTHKQLTEKSWLVYCAKVWDNVKKSPFFVEYTKLMP